MTDAEPQLIAFRRLTQSLCHDLVPAIEAARAACDHISGARSAAAFAESARDVEQQLLKPIAHYLSDLQRLARGAVREETIDPADLIGVVVAQLRARPKWREVTFACNGSAPTILGDRDLLERAIVGLAETAASSWLSKASRCELRCVVSESTDGDTVEIAIEGSNPQVPAADESTWWLTRNHPGEIGVAVLLAECAITAHNGQLQQQQTQHGINFRAFLPHHAP